MTINTEDRMSCSVHLAEDGRSVVILDQRKLPNRLEYLELRTAEEMYDAIKTLAVRGAPAIGICSAYCMYILISFFISPFLLSKTFSGVSIACTVFIVGRKLLNRALELLVEA